MYLLFLAYLFPKDVQLSECCDLLSPLAFYFVFESNCFYMCCINKVYYHRYDFIYVCTVKDTQEANRQRGASIEGCGSVQRADLTNKL